jgi:hypothetical protein
MSIALPVRRRRPTAKSDRICRPREQLLSVLPAIVEFVTTRVTILLGAFFPKREVQIFGEVLLGYGHGYAYSRVGDRGHDCPEHHHHTCDARGESGFRRRPMGEAEGRQR